MAKLDWSRQERRLLRARAQLDRDRQPPRRRGRPPGVPHGVPRRRGYLPSLDPAHTYATTNAGTVFPWAESLVRALFALQHEELLYGAPFEQVDYEDGCQFCGRVIVSHRDAKRMKPQLNASRTAGGWVACLRCKRRLRAVEGLGHYQQAREPHPLDEPPIARVTSDD